MNINTNIQSFSSQSGIKVTQNGNSNQSIDKNKNSEANKEFYKLLKEWEESKNQE